MMSPDLEILKNLSLPVIEELSTDSLAFRNHLNSDFFWNDLKNILLSDKNATPEITSFITNYNIQDRFQFTERIPILKNEYISYLASIYSDGETNSSIQQLLNTRNALFLEEVEFQKDLATAVIIMEGARLKNKHSVLNEALQFEISDAEVANGFKALEQKNTSNYFREKMKEWDTELSLSQLPEDVPTAKKAKAIPFLRVSYAAAACFIGAMVFIGFRFHGKHFVETITLIKDDTLKKSFETASTYRPKLIDVKVYKIILPIISETGVGFGSTRNKKREEITMIIQDVLPLISSIETAINKAKIDSAKTDTATMPKYELDSLKNLRSSYTFAGDTIHIYSHPEPHAQMMILRLGSEFFFKQGNDFYKLVKTEKPLNLAKITNKILKEDLDRVIFQDNNVK